MAWFSGAAGRGVGDGLNRGLGGDADFSAEVGVVDRQFDGPPRQEATSVEQVALAGHWTFRHALHAAVDRSRTHAQVWHCAQGRWQA